MRYRVDRIEGRLMPVNSFLVHGPDGVVVVDGMLTVSDAALVRQAMDDSGDLAGVIVTHPHPDHYAGLAHLVGPDDVPIVATKAVDEIIRRDDHLKDEVVGPMMGDEWPSRRVFPNQVVDDGDDVRLGGVSMAVRELGPGESHVDSCGSSTRATSSPGTLPTTACTPTWPTGAGGNGSARSHGSNQNYLATSPCMWVTDPRETRGSCLSNAVTSRHSSTRSRHTRTPSITAIATA